MSFFTGELGEVEHDDYKTLNIYITPSDSPLPHKLAEVRSFKCFFNLKNFFFNIYFFYSMLLFLFFCSINSCWVARKYTFLKHFEKLFCQYFSAGIKVLSSVFSSRITYDILSNLILWLTAITIHWKCQWEEWFLDIFDF